MDKTLRPAFLPIALVCAASLHAQILAPVMATQPAGTDITVSDAALGSSGSCNSPTVTLSGGNAGDLIVCTVAGQGYTASSVSDGTSSLTPLTSASSGSEVIRMFYMLSGNGPGKTYTASTSCGGPTRIQCIDVNAPSPKTWHYETSNQAIATGTNVSSGNISTTHNDEIVYFADRVEYPGTSITCPTQSSVLFGSNSTTNLSFSPYDEGQTCQRPPTPLNFSTYSLLNRAFSGDGNSMLTSSELWLAVIGAWYAQ